MITAQPTIALSTSISALVVFSRAQFGCESKKCPLTSPASPSPAFATTAATEGKVLLADMSAITLLNYGPPQLIVDAFSNGKSTTG